MPRGFDTTENCAPKAADIEAASYDFVARYLSQSPWKTVTPAEATALSDAKLCLVLVYEDGPTKPAYFSRDRGQADATRAAQQAEALGAPAGTAIYYAVDYDASRADIAGVIAEYFNGIADTNTARSAAGATDYGVGVYGSGATCIALTAAALAKYGWLAQSRGWAGFGTYTDWTIKQAMAATVLGIAVDPDEAVDDYGAMQPSNPTG